MPRVNVVRGRHVLTMGPAGDLEGGAVAFAGGEVVRAAAPRMAAVDATGAGDAFDAGFIAGWLDEAA